MTKINIDENMKSEIQEFVVEWKNKTEKDIDLWEFYWDALELLEQILENKQ
jgi:hypothetical protein